MIGRSKLNEANEPTKEQLAKLPKLYETEKSPLKDKPIYFHFFIGVCDWFVSEYDGEDLFLAMACSTLSMPIRYAPMT